MKLLVKLSAVTVCLLMVLLLAPAGGISADNNGYTLQILSPAGGADITTPEITISISYTVPPDSRTAILKADIKAVSLDEPGNDAWLNEVCELVTTPGFLSGSDTDTFTQYFAGGWSSLGGQTPAGQYKIEAFIRDLDPSVPDYATATSYFHFGMPDVPAAPSNLTAVLNGTYVDLKWTDNANNETDYFVERATSSDFLDNFQGFEIGPNATSYTDKTVGGSTTYYYAVYATNDRGSSDISNVASITTPGMQLIVPPAVTFQANREVVVIGRPVELSWSVTGADTVSIDQGVGGVAASGTVSLNPNLPTDYTLSATNTAGTSTQTVSVWVAPTPLDAILYLYSKLDLTGRDYGLGMANGFYADATHMFSAADRTKTIGTVDGEKIRVSVMDDGGIICGHYQAAVLSWLDALRKSPTYHDLTDGVDYSPVASPDEFLHHWVRIWPKGDNPATSGFNLDPWFNQATEYSPGVKYSFIPDLLYSGDYPLTGGTNYPTGYAQYTYIPPPKTQSIVIHCPVNVLITNQAGERLGWDGSEVVNEIKGAGVMQIPAPDGTYIWYFGLTLDDTYKTEITGTAGGTFEMLLATKDNVQDYGAQPISEGAVAQVTLDPTTTAPVLTLPGGKTVTPKGVSPNPAPSPKGVSLSLILGIAGGVVVMLIILGLVRRKKK